VVVTTDAGTNTAGDEVTIARVLVLHEDRVAAEDRRRSTASDQDVAAKLGKVREDYEGGDQQQPSEHGFRL
jgi:hypothetical protein